MLFLLHHDFKNESFTSLPKKLKLQKFSQSRLEQDRYDSLKKI